MGTEGGLAAPLLEWSVQPWRRDPKRAAAALAILAVSIAGCWWLGGQWFFGLLAAAVLWGSIGPFFVTSRYVMDEEGVAIDSPFLKRRRRWDEIRAWYVDDHGATLSPFAGKSWLEAYRSIRLLFGDREEDIRKILNERLGEPSRP